LPQSVGIVNIRSSLTKTKPNPKNFPLSLSSHLPAFPLLSSLPLPPLSYL
jgi:hypothetical protein